MLAGKPLARYLEFPPVTRYVEHAPFSWPVFFAFTVFIIGTVAPLVIRVVTSRLTPGPSPLTPHPSPVTSLPWWGWLGLGITGLVWVLAWNRFPSLGDLQSHTFTPLWVGYILVMNALAYRRTGSCMMR